MDAATLTPSAERVRTYFRKRAARLATECEEAVLEHSGLLGGHREKAIHGLLTDILPRRYSVDRGMVYAENTRSQEADAVVWDAFNYPRIPQGNAFLFFARSVDLIVEVKSQWKTETRLDILEKARSVRDLISVDLECRDENGRIVTGPERMARPLSAVARCPEFAAIAIAGGQQLKPRDFTLDSNTHAMPQLVLLLEAGKVVWTRRAPSLDPASFHPGKIEIVDAGDDALLFFVAKLITLLAERSEHLTEPLYLDAFCRDVLRDLRVTGCQFGALDGGRAILHAIERSDNEGRP